MARNICRNVSDERISNRRFVEEAIQASPDLKNDDLTKLANIFLRKTKGMRKKHVRKYIEKVEGL
jgi:hypothetical protein